jgi:2-(1,2-epoxy-1,2-dihydrophenyl)acetyl-CoA isomerase
VTAQTETLAAALRDSAPLVLAERREAVTVLTLNRPARLNALTSELLLELHDRLVAARDDRAVRAVVLTGAGRGFCAGADLAGVTEPDHDVRQVLATRYSPVISLIRAMETPVIAAVNGVAAGAGLSLALACDLRVCADTATFIQAFVRVGLVPDAGGTFFLPRLVGFARAAEMMMLGDTWSAADAERTGVVNRSVPAETLMDEAMRIAARLAAGPRSIGLIKRALNLSLVSDLGTQLQHEEDLQALAAASEDSKEGVLAFVEKRPTRFSGR